MKEFAIFSCLTYGFLFLGWGIRYIRPPWERHSKNLTRLTLLLVETPMICLIFWGIEVGTLVSHLPLSLVGVAVLSLSGVAGRLVAGRYTWPRQATGTFTVAAMLSNNGPTLGGFICLLYLGGEGLELSQVWALLLVPYFFTAVFMVARAFSAGEKLGFKDVVKANFRDPISVLPIAATVIGLALSVCKLPFPASLEGPRSVLVFVSVALYSLSFGVGMHLRRILRSWSALLGMLPVKFVAAPLFGVCLAFLFGYRPGTDPLAFKVIVIQASMPVAIWSVVACKLFDLDGDLAVGLWIFSTLAVAPLVPLFGWLATWH